jgi:hypothetical protein
MDISVILAIISIVVAVAIGIWQIVLARRQIQLSKLETINVDQAKSEEPSDNDYIRSPLPSDIVNQIRDLPIGQRDAVKSSYLGLKVQWLTTLKDMHIIQREKITVAHLMLLDQGRYPWVSCDVELSRYPELNILKEGHRVWVKGEINKIDGNVIKLTNCEIQTG